MADAALRRSGSAAVARQMTFTLNPALFVRRLPLLAVRALAPAVGALRSVLRSHNVLLSMPRVKGVVPDETDVGRRLLLLAPQYSDAAALPPAALAAVSQAGGETVPYELVLTMENWTAHEMLRLLLPPSVVDVPTSFESVGHIGHVNLREEHGPFKEAIGAVLLAKNAHLRTIVNKVGAIEGTFRVLPMEVLAGDPETVVTVAEEGCTFTFDYAKVYWNSRLQAEHARLVATFGADEAICDLFCGVGPFAIPAARKGCTVFANDLNPDSIAWLRVNSRANGIPAGRLTVSNGDARAVLGDAFRALGGEAGGQEGRKRRRFAHYIMNLPAAAETFLDLFTAAAAEGILTEADAAGALVHCYVFCRAEEDPIGKVASALGHAIAPTTAVRRVRNVAPNKDMFCVSFALPASIFAEGREGKRARLDG